MKCDTVQYNTIQNNIDGNKVSYCMAVSRHPFLVYNTAIQYHTIQYKTLTYFFPLHSQSKAHKVTSVKYKTYKAVRKLNELWGPAQYRYILIFIFLQTLKPTKSKKGWVKQKQPVFMSRQHVHVLYTHRPTSPPFISSPSKSFRQLLELKVVQLVLNVPEEKQIPYFFCGIMEALWFRDTVWLLSRNEAGELLWSSFTKTYILCGPHP